MGRITVRRRRWHIATLQRSRHIMAGRLVGRTAVRRASRCAVAMRAGAEVHTACTVVAPAVAVIRTSVCTADAAAVIRTSATMVAHLAVCTVVVHPAVCTEVVHLAVCTVADAEVCTADPAAGLADAEVAVCTAAGLADAEAAAGHHGAKALGGQN